MYTRKQLLIYSATTCAAIVGALSPVYARDGSSEAKLGQPAAIQLAQAGEGKGRGGGSGGGAPAATSAPAAKSGASSGGNRAAPAARQSQGRSEPRADRPARATQNREAPRVRTRDQQPSERRAVRQTQRPAITEQTQRRPASERRVDRGTDGRQSGTIVRRDRPNYERQVRRGTRYNWGPGAIFYFYNGYYHGDCAWLRRKAISTGSEYWRRRFRQCRAFND